MKKIWIIWLAAISLTACDLERLPATQMQSKQVEENPSENLDALVTGMYAQLKSWSDPMHRCGEYAGDNMMIRGSSTDAFFEFISFSRTPNNYRLQSFWDQGYKAIAQASNILKMVKEGQGKEIDNQLGECYFVRGMMYFYLCRAYGRPYYQAPDKNLGVPIVNGTPDDVLENLHLDNRATVKATYEQAINDLKQAEKLMTIDKGPAYASKEAAQALLSRVYLYMSGTYENPNREYAKLAVEYADKVINSKKYQLLSRNDFMKYNTFTPESNKESIFVVKRVASEFSGYDHYYGIGGMYANIGGMGWGEMYASAKYIDLLNETGRNDWRPDHYRIIDARAAFIEPTYGKEKTEVFRFIYQNEKGDCNYAQFDIQRDGKDVKCIEKTEKESTITYNLKPIDEQQGTYKIVYHGKEYAGMIDYYIHLNRAYPQFYIVKCSREGEDSHLHSPIISRLGEIYLNRAEAYAKLGEYEKARIDLNTIRERSIPNAGYPSLDASNAGMRIDKERQLELAFQAERSYDVFRNGKSLTRHYPGPHRQQEDIPATDYRVTYYIPQKAINAYPGTLTQNPTDNSGVVLK
ncbi:RagB/SusD family nutrient uptake outer membrane protein [Hoylesella timonensis]|uniref:SusD family protein n=1 Tax=Hoylesella timonensis CRIS 5C-B1 TaxID=679189 RepID=D1W0J1_9BACT|nr:RagB/SusD family nutrient uptake outer membrane protein [Hoylesella timonensis]EFA97093.1 SusD family protein [Hoylesella timonensis CRIS 5C-B1]